MDNDSDDRIETASAILTILTENTRKIPKGKNVNIRGDGGVLQYIKIETGK